MCARTKRLSEREALPYLFSFILGSVIGSFLNVCIYRLPMGESIVFPPSHCTSCGRAIRFYNNIPILSYLMLKGKCADCGSRISIQYPLVELLSGVALTSGYFKFRLLPHNFFFSMP